MKFLNFSDSRRVADLSTLASKASRAKAPNPSRPATVFLKGKVLKATNPPRPARNTEAQNQK